jgi:Domain of unknown function (DUF1906)/Bacterial SH3 domain
VATVLDTTQDCTSKASALRGAGYTTIMRYYSVNAWKRMGAPEAQALSQAGLMLGAVYQDRQNQPADFSLAQGTTAGQNALHYAQTVIMQPTGSAIYFSADFDPTQDVVTNNILPFFQGVKNAMTAAGDAPYRVGVYGSGLTCGAVLGASLAQCAWLAQSKGFSGYQDFLNSKKWNLSQQMPATVLGIGCDPDDTNPALPDFGAFTLAPNHFGLTLPPASRFVVNASSGLQLRGGPGTNYPSVSVLSAGTPVTVLLRDGDWAQVDTTGNGTAGGYVFAAYLKPA